MEKIEENWGVFFLIFLKKKHKNKKEQANNGLSLEQRKKPNLSIPSVPMSPKAKKVKKKKKRDTNYCYGE
jgi:hypothetical protein